MRFGQGLAFVIDGSWAFLRVGWWLTLLAGAPFLLSEMVRWGQVAPAIGPYFAASMLTALLDLYVFLVVVRFVAGGRGLGLAMRPGAVTLRRFLPYAVFATILAGAEYYVSLTDESVRTYWLVTAVTAAIGALLAPWAVASGLGIAGCGPRRSIHMAAPHFAWSVLLYAILVALENAGYFLINYVQLPIPDIQFLGLNFTYVGFGIQSLVFGSLLTVAYEVATIAIARRSGLMVSTDEETLRETFS